MSMWIALLSVIIIIAGVIRLIQNPDMKYKTVTIVVLVLLAIITVLNVLGI